jgi:hypothetical protein
LSGLESALRALLVRLAQEGVACALVGGLAVSTRTEPRFTRDVDLCVACEDDAAAQRLVRRLRGAGYVLDALLEQEAMGRIAAVRLYSPAGADPGVRLDLLFASSGIEPEIVAAADEMEVFQGVSARVATVGALIALKVLARDDAKRPQDRVDLQALLRGASSGDVEEASRLLELVSERGFSRGRDLASALASARREAGR